MLAESEAKRNRHLQELEDIRLSREQMEAQLAEAEAKLRHTQAALVEVQNPALLKAAHKKAES